MLVHYDRNGVSAVKTGKRRTITTPAFFVGIFLLAMLTAVMIFTSQSARLSEKTVFRSLLDSASAAGAAVRDRLSDQYAVLESCSHLFSNKKSIDSDGTRRDMAAIAQTGHFDFLSIALPDGSAFSQTGERFDASSFYCFHKAMSGSSAVEKFPAESPDESGYFLLSVPVYKYGAVSAVLSARLPGSVFSDLFTTSAFGGESDLFVTDSSGGVIIGSRSGTYPEGTLFLDVISDSRILSGAAADKLAANLNSGASGTMVYENGRQKQYAVYVPLEIEGWTIFNAVSGKPVETVSRANNRIIYGLAACAFLFTLLLFAVFFSREAKYSRLLQREADSLRQSEQLYRVVEEFSEGVIFEGNLLTDTLRFNANYQQIFGHPPILNKSSDFAVIQPLIYIDDAPDCAQFGRKMLTGEPPRGNIDYRVCGTSGQPVWHRLEYRTITTLNGRPAKIIGRIQNIDAEKTRLLRLQVMAESDSLTGLCNNASFKEKVDHYLQNDGMNGEHFLMLIDLDDFKCVNDTFGHAEGDRILQLFGTKIRPLFRTSDIIGRIGGDEFAIFVKDFSQARGISAKAEDICELISILGGSFKDFTLTCSIGISVYKRDGINFLELFKRADTALYQAKRIGKGRFSIYDPAFSVIGTR